MTFNYLQDPGHGWLRVPREDFVKLASLRIRRRITAYSRMDERSVYLEEDCDMPLFLGHLANKGLEAPRIREFVRNSYSPVRLKAPYHV